MNITQDQAQKLFNALSAARTLLMNTACQPSDALTDQLRLNLRMMAVGNGLLLREIDSEAGRKAHESRGERMSFRRERNDVGGGFGRADY